MRSIVFKVECIDGEEGVEDEEKDCSWDVKVVFENRGIVIGYMISRYGIF